MNIKIKTIISDDSVRFDSMINEFISRNTVLEIDFCSDSSEYIAHIQFIESDNASYEFATIKPIVPSNLQYQQ